MSIGKVLHIVVGVIVAPFLFILVFLPFIVTNSGLSLGSMLDGIKSSSLWTGNRPSVDWSEEEKENAVHFIRSLDADNEAARLSSAGDTFTVLSEEEHREILRLSRLALEEAGLVEDAILEKITPGMSRPYREEFERSHELNIENLEVGNTQAAITSFQLRNEWWDWYDAHKKKMKIPKPSRMTR